VELIYLDHVEWYLGERVLRQFGIYQPVPDPPPQSFHASRTGGAARYSLLDTFRDQIRHFNAGGDLFEMDLTDREDYVEWYATVSTGPILPPLAGFFGKLHLFWCGWQAGLYFLVSIGLLTSVVSIYYYLKIIKLLMTGRNQEITPYVRNYRRSPLRSNNSIELSMTVCVIASTIPGISMNPIIAIAQDTLFSF